MTVRLSKVRGIETERISIGREFAYLSSVLSVFISSIAVTILVAIQGQNGEIREFFGQQARSILSGTFEVEPEALPGECYWFTEKCFGYFGITPSLLRLPLIVLFDHSGDTSIFLIGAIVLGLVASCLILFELSKTLGFWNTKNLIDCKRGYLILLIAVVPGNLLFQLTRPAGQWEIIAWSSSLSLFGIYYILKWNQFASFKYLVFSGIFFTLAANARVTSGLIAFAIGLTCALRIRNTKIRDKNRHYFGAVMLAIIPTLTTLLILYLKFQSFFPNLTLHEQVPEAEHWKAILEINGGKTVGLVFFLTNLFTYLRPDSLIFVDFLLMPVRPNLVPVENLFPLQSGGMYNESSASITNLAPFGLVMFIYVLWIAVRQFVKRGNNNQSVSVDLSFLNRLCFATLLGLFITFTFVASSNRYLGDFVPALVLFSIFGGLLLMRSEGFWRERANVIVIFSLVVIGALANLLSAWARARFGLI